MTYTIAIIVAAGRGSRAVINSHNGDNIPKQYVKLTDGKTVLSITVDVFLRCPDIDNIQVVINDNDLDLYKISLQGYNILPPVYGGTTRQESVNLGLKAIADYNPMQVVIHDAARPFVNNDIISKVLRELRNYEAAIAAIPIFDTIKKSNNNLEIISNVDRNNLWAAQTPQAFNYKLITAAHGKAMLMNENNFTDDAAVAQWAGMNVKLVDGDIGNKKLTTRGDIIEAQNNMQSRKLDFRIGHGFDAHAFIPGEYVILCGVKIPHEFSLQGHSDADVVYHALTDALLGCIGAGDIGVHFLPSDPRWKDKSSDIFVNHAKDLINQQGGIINNVDITIVCEEPKIVPHIKLMKEHLYNIINISQERINIKATTTEQLGFTGRKEGIAAMAVATVLL